MADFFKGGFGAISPPPLITSVDRAIIGIQSNSGQIQRVSSILVGGQCSVLAGPRSAWAVNLYVLLGQASGPQQLAFPSITQLLASGYDIRYQAYLPLVPGAIRFTDGECDVPSNGQLYVIVVGSIFSDSGADTTSTITLSVGGSDLTPSNARVLR